MATKSKKKPPAKKPAAPKAKPVKAVEVDEDDITVETPTPELRAEWMPADDFEAALMADESVHKLTQARINSRIMLALEGLPQTILVAFGPVLQAMTSELVKALNPTASVEYRQLYQAYQKAQQDRDKASQLYNQVLAEYNKLISVQQNSLQQRQTTVHI